MSADLNLLFILVAALFASASPGPATLAILSTSMSLGRVCGLALACGIACGALIWSTLAAMGLGALMYSHLWVLETLRYFGGIYLLYLAYKAIRSALSPVSDIEMDHRETRFNRLFLKGFVLDMTNPKAMLFFVALYSVGVPEGATFWDLCVVVCAIGFQTFVLFYSFVLIFSSARIGKGYLKFKSIFEGLFALGFASLGIKIFMTRLQ